MVFGGRGTGAAEGQVVVVSCHAGDASAMASTSRGKTLDLWTTTPSTTDRPSGSSVNHATRTRKHTLGYQRIVGELKGLGVVVSANTVKKILRQ
jgi:hypothetical protein